MSKGFDPLELPSPRLMSAAYYYMQTGLNDEERTAFNSALQNSAAVGHLLLRSRPSTGRTTRREGLSEAPTAGRGKWEAPPGWTPPGWLSDEASYRNAQQFMSWQKTLGS